MFNLVSRESLFKILAKTGCPARLQSMIKSFHTGVKRTVQFNGSSSKTLLHLQWLKVRLCSCSNTLQDILWCSHEARLWHCNWKNLPVRKIRWQSLQPRSPQSQLRQRSMKLWSGRCCLQMMQLLTHIQQQLQLLIDSFSKACKNFGLTISLKKTNVIGQSTGAPPVVTTNNYVLEVVHDFTYVGSTITDNLSLDKEINKRIGKAATTLAYLTTRVWTNPKLTVKTKVVVNNACVISTLLYGNETWTMYVKQEKQLNTFNLRSIGCILDICWQDKVTNAEVLSLAGLRSMFTLLRQCRLCCLGYVLHFAGWPHPKSHFVWRVGIWEEKGWLPPATIKRCCGDMKSIDIVTDSWESLADDCSEWKGTPKKTFEIRGRETCKCFSRKVSTQKGEY